MKACSCCGVEIPDGDIFCEFCKNELAGGGTPKIPKTETPEPAHSPGEFFLESEPLDVSSIDMGCEFVEGVSQPEWRRIGENIKAAFPEEAWPQAWRQVSRQWIAQIRDDLGGSYRHYETENFLFLSAESPENCGKMLATAEEVVRFLAGRLGPANLTARRKVHGKRVILVFSEKDDYYAYISYFYRDGQHTASAGVFIHKGYGHIALPFAEMSAFHGVIVHESTHNCLMGLRLPLWLNEGLCRRMERELGVSGRRQPGVIVTNDSAREHDEWWDEEKIQEFWAGTSFYRPDEGNRLSYDLGQILVELLSEDWGGFLDFVLNADAHDGGQDAALTWLGQSLGDVLGGFLGPGDWRPSRKIIAELWARGKKAKSSDGPG